MLFRENASKKGWMSIWMMMDVNMDDIVQQRRIHRGRRYTERLTDLKARRLIKPGRHADGANLYQFISQSGCKSWVFVFTRGGQKHEYGLGKYPDTSLAAARAKAKEHRVILSVGGVPRSSKEAAEALQARIAEVMMVGEACDQFIVLSGWRRGTLISWRCSFGKSSCRPLLETPISAVTTEDIAETIKLFQPIAQRTFLMRLAKVFDWLGERGFISRGHNPARFRIEHHLAVEKPRVQHRAALLWLDAPLFMRDLRALGISGGKGGIAASVLELQILTCTRPAEARGARWEEFDEDAKVWTIPPERMKQGHQFRVPLSDQALAVLHHMKNGCESGLVFHNPNGSEIGRKFMENLCKERGIHQHGFRSTFDDWAASHELSFELTELSLAYKFGSQVSQAYRRTDLLEQRRPLIQQWADFLDGGPRLSDIQAVRRVEAYAH
jgi:integrase